MLGDPFTYRVGRYGIVHDHCLPGIRFPLGTDYGAPCQLDPFLEDFPQDLDLTFIRDCVQREVVDDQEMEIQYLPDSPLILRIVALL